MTTRASIYSQSTVFFATLAILAAFSVAPRGVYAAVSPPTATTPTAAQQATVAPTPDAWKRSHALNAGKSRFATGKGLELNSDDGLFRLQLRPRAQMLYELTDSPGDGDTRERSQAVSIRRARFVASGHMWAQTTTFKMELAFSPGDLGMTDNKSGNPPITNRDNTVSRSPLLDFYVQFGQYRDFNVRVGQSKVPYSRQRVISSGDLMLVDRAITNSEFNLDRDIGIDLRSQDLFGLGGKLRYYLGVYAGEGHSSSDDNDFGMMYIGRVEALPMGSFSDYSESDQSRDSKARLSIGAAYGLVQGAKGNKGILGKRPADGGTTDTQNFAADAMFMQAGFSLQTEFYWRKGTRIAGSKTDKNDALIAVESPRDGWGAMAQAGYLLPGTDVEIAGRYAQIRGGEGSSLNDGNEAGGGVNYYFASHALKLQSDVFRLWSKTASDASISFRLQLQAAF